MGTGTSISEIISSRECHHFLEQVMVGVEGDAVSDSPEERQDLSGTRPGMGQLSERLWDPRRSKGR